MESFKLQDTLHSSKHHNILCMMQVTKTSVFPKISPINSNLYKTFAKTCKVSKKN